MANLPYAQSASALQKAIENIKKAAVPDKISQDFITTKLGIKGGTGRALLPTIKKMGLVSAEGTPTILYKQLRNPAKSGQAVAECMKKMYSPLFEVNEYVYELKDKELKGLIVEVTGANKNSEPVRRTVATFLILKKMATFDKDNDDIIEPEDNTIHNFPPTNAPMNQSQPIQIPQGPTGINLSYTINLNLPPTKDIEVFHAIFKSLKQHLLQE